MGAADVIVDTSALIAMLRSEPERASFRECLLQTRQPRLSLGTLIEARIIAERLGIRADLEELLLEFKVALVPVDEAQATAALAEFLNYGKGRHPAALNLGDLFAYALAKVTGEPLLFKGNDFARTDLVPAYTQISDVQSPPG
jgi:ribonuclease VapC